jgi:hypothetical protein
VLLSILETNHTASVSYKPTSSGEESQKWIATAREPFSKYSKEPPPGEDAKVPPFSRIQKIKAQFLTKIEGRGSIYFSAARP